MQTQIEQLYNPLFSYVKKRINNKEDAEDLTQEVFYKLSKSKNDGVENIKSWVYTIAQNTIIDYYRKNRVHSEDVEHIAIFEEENDDQAVVELSGCIGSFVKALPEEYRSLMTLSELENVSQKEIAQKLNLNYVTVRSKIQRGRKKLKEMFSDCCQITQGGKGRILDFRPSSDCGSGDC